jgi:hypothetical protein
MLNGTNRPSKVLVINFLRTVGVDDRTREEWEAAWDRVAFSTFSSRDSTGRPDVTDGATVERSSEDVIYEVAADVVDIVRAVATHIRDDILRDLTQVVSDARAAFAEIDNLRQSARDATAQAKQSAAEIVERALREAENIKKNAKSDYQASIPSLLDTPTPTIFSPSNSILMPGATSLPPTPKGVSDKRPPTTDSSKQSPLELKIGDRVNHDKYGSGTVRAREGVGSRATAIIDFDEAGPVKLMLIAGVPLTKSDKEDSEPPF